MKISNSVEKLLSGRQLSFLRRGKQSRYYTANMIMNHALDNIISSTTHFLSAQIASYYLMTKNHQPKNDRISLHLKEHLVKIFCF